MSEEPMGIEEANAFRDWPDAETYRCRCGTFLAIGPPGARAIQFRYHWMAGCTAVSSLAYHPDGSLAGVGFTP